MQFTIPLYDALLGANIPPEKAKAVVEALEKETDVMSAKLATKEDLTLLESRLTIMLFAAIGLAVALMKVL